MQTDRAGDENQPDGLPSRHEALRHFATFDGPTQSQQHIKPLHRYVTTRLVLEGGFAPDELRPRPPLDVVSERGASRLVYAPDNATNTEATILGGLKTKAVDIVVTKDGIGPVLAISCKGMTGAFRNLTNRLEETIGECTNIHIGYSMLVFGYLFVARAHRANQHVPPSDVAFADPRQPVEALLRFHAALTEMTGRRGVRNDLSRYEAVGMALVDTRPASVLGRSWKSSPRQQRHSLRSVLRHPLSAVRRALRRRRAPAQVAYPPRYLGGGFAGSCPAYVPRARLRDSRGAEAIGGTHPLRLLVERLSSASSVALGPGSGLMLA